MIWNFKKSLSWIKTKLTSRLYLNLNKRCLIRLKIRLTEIYQERTLQQKWCKMKGEKRWNEIYKQLHFAYLKLVIVKEWIMSLQHCWLWQIMKNSVSGYSSPWLRILNLKGSIYQEYQIYTWGILWCHRSSRKNSQSYLTIWNELRCKQTTLLQNGSWHCTLISYL